VTARSLPPAIISQQPVITVNYDSAQIADVIAGFAAYSGKSIVLGEGVTGVVTARINNQPWDVAFRSILDAHGLTAIEDPPGLIRVDSRTVLAARDSLEQLDRVVIRVNYARAASLVPAVQAVITSRGKVVADTATNSLIITDVVSRIQADSQFVSQLDVRTPQVSIQAKLIFVNRTDIEQLGVRYDLGTNEQFFNRLVQRPDPSTAQPVDLNGDGVPDALRASDVFDQGVNIINLGGNALSAIANAEAPLPSPALQLIFSTAIGNFNLTSFVNALQQVDLADLQAEPLISTSDNTEAYILVGERTPIRQIDVSAPTTGGQNVPRATTEIVPTGIQLKVTPHVTANGQVMMKIRAENSSVQAAPADVGFTFQTQEAENQILVNNGETAVIGGLTVTQVTISKTGVPFLVDLPIIGRMFGFSNRNENRRDLLILVTPHIIEETPPGERS
jgi:type IV pilus assembly protein PilQ